MNDRDGLSLLVSANAYRHLMRGPERRVDAARRRRTSAAIKRMKRKILRRYARSLGWRGTMGEWNREARRLLGGVLSPSDIASSRFGGDDYITATNGASLPSAWTHATPAEIVADISRMTEEMRQSAEAIHDLDEKMRAIVGCWCLGTIGKNFRYLFCFRTVTP